MTAKHYDQEAGAAQKWWRKLQLSSSADDTQKSDESAGHQWAKGDRAALAKLKRADTLLEAAAEPETIELFFKLGFEKHNANRDLPRAALIAAVLAHVRKNDDTQKIAQAIGQPRAGEDSTAKITPLRFKRLIAARTPNEMLIAFRRVVAILGKSANVKDLARILLSFTDPDDRRVDIARTQLAFAYHGATNYAPNQSDSPAQQTETHT